MTDITNEMSPAEPEGPGQTPPTPAGSPEDFRLRGSLPLVTRLSRKAMAVIGIAAGIGIGGSLIYALHQRHPVTPSQSVFSGEAHAKSELVTGAPADYSKVPKLGRPLPGDLGRPILDAQTIGETVPVPPMGSQSDPRAVEAEQARQRLVQERDAARSSRLFLGGSNAAAQSATPAAVLPIDGGQSISRSPAGVGATSGNGPSEKTGKREFLKVAANRPTESAERLTAPVSPYVVQAGSIIPAALITGIRSDLPGQITAQVTENVYDSPTGRILLIPQGSRLIGEYDSDVSAGQNRVLLAWDRLILPGGHSILLDRQPGGDAAGMAGLEDQTNHHWGSVLKATLVSTLLGGGTELATANDSALIQALRYGTQDTVNQTGRNLVQRETDVPPTLTIRPGFPLRVIVTRDLVLTPVER
jgi:type IV secretory pathway VirB10-like protein